MRLKEKVNTGLYDEEKGGGMSLEQKQKQLHLEVVRDDPRLDGSGEAELGNASR